MEWRKDHIFKLIRYFRQCDCLWNYKNKAYKQQSAKESAWLKIAKKFRKDPEEVKKKIKYLRTAYVAEKNKVDESKKCAGSSGEIYKSTLFYYKELSFLDPFIVQRKINYYETSDAPNQVEEPEPPAKKPKIVENRKSLEKRKPLEIKATSHEDDIIEELYEHPKANNNVADNLAKVWSAQYTELSDRQKVFARTIFSDVLFCGYLGRLTESTVENMHSVLRNNRQLTSPIETICNPLYEECAVSPASDSSEHFLIDDIKNSRYSED